MKQIELLKQPSKKYSKAYGGSLAKTRSGRAGPRPLATKQSMHLSMKSSKATGQWSFLKSKNDRIVRDIILRFAKKYGVQIRTLANVGNHLHMQVRLTNRHSYAAFIRAITGAIAIKVTGKNRWENSTGDSLKNKKLKFWDHRPFTRIVTSLREILNLKDYIQINALEGMGHTRQQARFLIEWDRRRNTS